MAAVDKSGLVGEQFVMKFGGTVEDSGNHIVRRSCTSDHVKTIAHRRMRWPEYVQNERMIAPLRTVVRRSLITVKKGSRVNSFVQFTIRGPSWLVIGWSPLLASASDIRDVASNLEQSSNVLLMCMVPGLFRREAILEQYP
ncbi:hypothetical protein EV702DRAFT_1048722 [Suillus placidus]|uniref:Uncharacterized protein n=1 Tax=Suillus placidus TaxID=48579 RepID=A0A9P6ZMY7_9AGAM|nr:hypothetical protein EV702DRAFT_1048722 [Suillus placidus]